MFYQPPIDDIATIFFQVLRAPASLQSLEYHAQTDAELMRQVLVYLRRASSTKQ